MKKYIFMTPSIINMGGAQMYIRNKVVWLEKQGWNVSIFSSFKGSIYLTELEELNILIEGLFFPYYYYSETKRNYIISKIKEYADCELYDEIIIESHRLIEASWAERLAKELKAKHIMFLLSENEKVTNKDMQSFCVFKHSRKEIAGITEISLENIFKEFSIIPNEHSYCLKAYCSNVVEDVFTPFIDNIDWKQYDYKIGCLSRINKPFIIHALSNFAEFVRKNKNKNFVLCMIGGDSENGNAKQKIYNIFKGIENIRLVFTGYMFPVSSKFLEIFDAFISSAGSSWVCMRSGVPTISVDGNDFMPIGVMGHTTISALFRGVNESVLDYQDIYYDVIINKKYPRLEPKHEITSPDFSSHIDFLKKSYQYCDYYDMTSVNCLLFSESVYKMTLFVLGVSCVRSLAFCKNRLLQNLSNFNTFHQ